VIRRTRPAINPESTGGSAERDAVCVWVCLLMVLHEKAGKPHSNAWPKQNELGGHRNDRPSLQQNGCDYDLTIGADSAGTSWCVIPVGGEVPASC